jgi:hypothetical protein
MFHKRKATATAKLCRYPDIIQMPIDSYLNPTTCNIETSLEMGLGYNMGDGMEENIQGECQH